MIQSPESFHAIVPRDLVGNLEFRRKLHSTLAGDAGMQKAFLEMVYADPKIAFDTMLWTYNPRSQPGCQHWPFILRPQQGIMVDRLMSAINNGHDLIVDKSRDEGATEVICKLFSLLWWLSPSELYFLVGSRKEELVDRSVAISHGRVIGPHQCLFHKIMYGLNNLPSWTRVKYEKKHRFLQNVDNGSMIEGEATNESFGAGNRATAVLVDEMARIEPDIAQNIADNIRDTTDCAIFNSTHFRWGAGHVYNKLIKSNKIEVCVLDWADNPEKSVGLYRSPKKDIIEIIDIAYYRQQSSVFDGIESYEPFNWTQLQADYRDSLEDVRFIADGGESNFRRERSIWFDQETVDRSRSRMDIAQNILRVPQGSAEMFFDNEMIERLRNTYAREAEYKGELRFSYDSSGHVQEPYFEEHSKGKLKWWGELQRKKRGTEFAMYPNLSHNYVVACDISRGTGSSNSVMAIMDVNTNEEVGKYVNGFIDVPDFAELAVAAARWLGNAYLIWEANGPGDTFGQRVQKQGYQHYYFKKEERPRFAKRTNRPGWYSTPGVNGTKFDMLNTLDAALIESLKDDKYNRYIVLHDFATLNELEDYIFDDGRIDVGLSTTVADDSTEGRYAHGDRVIATGLCLLGAAYTRPKVKHDSSEPPSESFAGRMKRKQQEKQEQAVTQRRFLY